MIVFLVATESGKITKPTAQNSCRIQRIGSFQIKFKCPQRLQGRCHDHEHEWSGEGRAVSERDLTSEGELPLTHRFGYQPKGNVGGFAKSEARSSILSNQASQLTDSCFFIIRSQYAEGELAWEFGTYFLLDQFEGLDKSWVQSQQQRT